MRSGSSCSLHASCSAWDCLYFAIASLVPAFVNASLSDLTDDCTLISSESSADAATLEGVMMDMMSE